METMSFCLRIVFKCRILVFICCVRDDDSPGVFLVLSNRYGASVFDDVSRCFSADG